LQSSNRPSFATPLTPLPDEYTALQKYISTYRDPKAHDPNAEVIEDDVKQPWYKFGSKKKAAGADPGAVPEEMLEADIKQGISSAEVEQRRKRYGWNEITTEKENLFIKFLGFFTGPVLYGKLIPLLFGSRQAGDACTLSMAISAWRRLLLLLQALTATRSYGHPLHPAPLVESGAISTIQR
jgi:magnesium-transporting ATPase (P-type)